MIEQIHLLYIDNSKSAMWVYDKTCMFILILANVFAFKVIQSISKKILIGLNSIDQNTPDETGYEEFGKDKSFRKH